MKLERAVQVFALVVIGVACAVLLRFLTGCSTASDAGGEVAEIVACPTTLIDCGHVYLCEQEADNALGHVEICIDDDTDGQVEAAELVYGACVPTPRHQGLCKFCCEADCGRGANAFNGTFCPTEGVSP